MKTNMQMHSHTQKKGSRGFWASGGGRGRPPYDGHFEIISQLAVFVYI